MQINVISLLIYFLICIIYANDETYGKTISEDYSDDVAGLEMKTIEKKAAIELPRMLLAHLLHKGKFFQDIFAEQPTPNKIRFGHVCENPQEWEQRFEQKDLINNRHQGKVRWGNKNGGYGEHYWDLHHAAAINDGDEDS